MDALARGLIHKRGCLTSETGRLDQSGASIEDAARVRRERGVCVCKWSNFIQKNAASLVPLPLRFTLALISGK